MEIGEIKRPSKETIEGFRQVSTSTISDVLDEMGISGIINGFRPLMPEIRVAGPAFTVKEVTGVLGTYSVIELGGAGSTDLLEQGDIFVCDLGGEQISALGDLLALSLKLKGAAGAIIDGGVRDVDQIRKEGFPVWAHHICATSCKTRAKWIGINIPIQVGGVRVNPGDIVVADDTSVAVVPLDKAEQVLEQGRRLEEVEREFRKRLRGGKTFTDVSKKLGVR
jgi:regulator of RNase E activity RraA